VDQAIILKWIEWSRWSGSSDHFRGENAI